MNMPRMISRWFSHDLPPFEEAAKAARAATRPWASEKAYAAFESVDRLLGSDARENA